VAKNMEEAARWFSKAATLGYVDSAFNLGVLYERGDGVPQSLLDAYKWYAIAANQGDAESKVRMSAMAGELPPDALAAAQKAAESFKPDQTGAVDLPKSGALR
jgi:localization factor PodJL